MKNTIRSVSLLVFSFAFATQVHSQDTCTPPPAPAAPPPVELNPDTNNVAVDDPNNPVQIAVANMMLDAEQAADSLENVIDYCTAAGEEPVMEDPADPDGYITGNEYLENNITPA